LGQERQDYLTQVNRGKIIIRFKVFDKEQSDTWILVRN